MCQSHDDGAKRCAAHTRPRYVALIEAMDAKASKTFNKGDGRKQARNGFSVDTADGLENALNVVANHASTPSGAKQVAADIARLRSEGDQSTVAFLTSAARTGQSRADAAKEITGAIKKAKEQAIRKVTGSRVELNRNPKVMDGLSPSLEEVFPGIAARWDTDHPGNKGILPSEVSPNTNGSIWLRCPQDHSWDGGRGNNVNAPIKSGKRYYPICPECEGRRPRLFAATQAEYGPLVAALGDTEAWNRLTPATQYQMLSELGFLRGSQDSMTRQIGMSIVHGDLTLSDMIAATDANKIKVREDLNDDTTVATITDLDTSDNDKADRQTKVASVESDADQILATTGTLSLIDPAGALAQDIAREVNDGFWKAACAPGTDLDTYVTFLNSRRGYDEHRDAAIDRFATELDTVRNTRLPAGYTADRDDEDGTVRTLDPTLAQMRFAVTVKERRRYMNWSGTGAGKTLSATLAVQGTGARESIVICPNAVTEQWAAEFSGGFPDNTDVRMGLPDPTNPLPDPAPGINRVWIVNYDKFSPDANTNTTDAVIRERVKALTSLSASVDAIVYDEVHMVKESDGGGTSNRRVLLEKFTDRAGEANANLVVIGTSATPVINNLSEAKSVLRLVEGPDRFTSFSTTSTMKNAATAHRRLASAGVRHMPDYPSKLTRHEEVIDISADVRKIQAHVNALRQKSTSGQMHPAMMEKALIGYKVPALVKKATQNKADGNGPTLIYSYYTTGMVDPMRTALEAEGLRVGTYTGGDTDAAKAESLHQFKNDGIDVLIGSKAIGTGIDGLQHTSANLIVVSAPWTAAEDDQLVGRLQRRGQLRDVSVTYLLTEATVGDARWSWDKDNRLKRIQFKRGLADAAVDGVLPDGALESQTQGAEHALTGLKDIAAAAAQTAA